MAIKRQVSAVDRQIAVESGFYLLIAAAGERNRRSPKEPVVADQEIDISGDGLLKGDLTGIDGSTDLGNLSEVLNLQAVVSAGEVFNFSLAGTLITKRDNLGEGGHGKMLAIN